MPLGDTAMRLAAPAGNITPRARKYTGEALNSESLALATTVRAAAGAVGGFWAVAGETVAAIDNSVPKIAKRIVSSPLPAFRCLPHQHRLADDLAVDHRLDRVARSFEREAVRDTRP